MNHLDSIAHSWHESLSFQLSDVGKLHFLDVALSFMLDRRIHWELYYKEQRLHPYVPAQSHHSSSILKSLQIGEALRCQKRNRKNTDAAASLKSNVACERCFYSSMTPSQACGTARETVISLFEKESPSATTEIFQGCRMRTKQEAKILSLAAALCSK